MYGIFVNENGCVPYPFAIVARYKTIETRNKNMLSALVGKRVAVIRTGRGKVPTIIGEVDIVRSAFCPAADFDKYYDQHLVQPGSKYACHSRGKWFYFLENAKPCDHYALPSSAIRHGRSWCEF